MTSDEWPCSDLDWRVGSGEVHVSLCDHLDVDKDICLDAENGQSFFVSCLALLPDLVSLAQRLLIRLLQHFLLLLLSFLVGLPLSGLSAEREVPLHVTRTSPNQ